ncbi:MAG: ABC transporter permease [Dehalococcoidia bacterium]|nr:ABC transporter permease [Dehalococcoidia bacterium]
MTAQLVREQLELEAEPQSGLWQRLYRGRERLLIGAMSVLVFGVMWETVSNLGLVDPTFLASPMKIFGKLGTMVQSGKLWPHLAASAEEFVYGYTSGVVLGLLMGLATGRIRWFDYVTSRFVNVLYVAPSIAFLPLLIIWFGLNVVPKVILILLMVIFPVLFNTYEGVRSTDASLIEAGRSYGAREKDIFFKIVLPFSVPFIVTGLRMGIGRGIIGIVVSEMYIASAGLGYLLTEARNVLDSATIFMSVMILAVTGLSLNIFVRSMELRIAPWLHERHAE